MRWLRTGWKWIAGFAALLVLYALMAVYNTVARDTWIFPDQPRALVYQELGLMAIIGVIGLVVLVRRGTDKVLLFWSGFAWLMLGTVFCGIVLGIINGALDGSPPERFETTVIRTTISGSRSKSYLVFVRDWRNTQPEIRLDRGRGFYDQAQPGDRVSITTRAGALGHEWIVDAKVLE